MTALSRVGAGKNPCVSPCALRPPRSSTLDPPTPGARVPPDDPGGG
jgi:hypothetical protein